MVCPEFQGSRTSKKGDENNTVSGDKIVTDNQKSHNISQYSLSIYIIHIQYIQIVIIACG